MNQIFTVLSQFFSALSNGEPLIKLVLFIAAILVAAFQIDINGIKRTFIKISKGFR